MYHVFPTILRGPTWEWYTHLKPLSVDSFALLVKEFEFYFLKNICPRPLAIMLLRLKQRKEETLSNFVA